MTWRPTTRFAGMLAMPAILLTLMSASGCARSTGANAFCDMGPYPYFDHEPADRWGDRYNVTYEKVCE